MQLYDELPRAVVLNKGKEHYIFTYTDSRKHELLRIFGEFASNECLSFTWYDAAVLSNKIRNQKEIQNG